VADVLKRERKRYPGASVPDFAKVNDMPQDGRIDDVSRVQLFFTENMAKSGLMSMWRGMKP
jgi:hypothetical protein